MSNQSIRIDANLRVSGDTGCKDSALCKGCPFYDCIRHKDTFKRVIEHELANGQRDRAIMRKYSLSKSRYRAILNYTGSM